MEVAEFYEKYVDKDKFYTLKELNDLMEDFKKENGGEVPGGPWMKLTNKLGEKMVFQEEVYEHFGEDDMLMLIKKDMDPIFKEYDYKTDRAPLFGHTFMPIQNILTRAAQLGYGKLFEYMTDNVAMEKYDIDRMNLAVAIKRGNVNIVEMIADRVDETTYGFDKHASFVSQMQREINTSPNLQTLPQRVKQKLKNKFDWIVIKEPTGTISLEDKIAKWEKLTKEELKDLVDNKSAANCNEEEYEELIKVYKNILQQELQRLEMEIKLEELKQ